ncbi:hypothetical protein ACFW6F_00215 [Streptomyces sp. NPDC058746]|uniref:hypothetical protein n=1 Tax=Streptomyces sp. NPDC058746 TaxID=3346622 RepID=UPI00369132E6
MRSLLTGPAGFRAAPGVFGRVAFLSGASTSACGKSVPPAPALADCIPRLANDFAQAG